jgi:MoxR-like ATPase/antitoxin component of RelBE/YafQ-DinJ toxin-antitoxin module
MNVNDLSGSKQKQFAVLDFFSKNKGSIVSPASVEKAAGVSYWRVIVKDLIEFGFDIEVQKRGRNVLGYRYAQIDNNAALYENWIEDAKKQMQGVRAGTTKSMAVRPAKAAKAERGDVSQSHFPTESVASTLSAPVEAEAETAYAQQTAQVIPMQRKNVLIGEADHLHANSLIPLRLETFVPFGNYDMVKQVIARGIFFPVFISGLSGNGKTLQVEQAAAALGRELIRVQVTPETDEDDLIGGYRLINGETVWMDGPVVIAAQRGAVCLIDEIDYGTGKISCLQGILEGKGIFIKKANRLITPKAGFNIIATANTKGRGSEEYGGRYVNTNIINESLLERFALTLEQEYPNQKVEKKILLKQFQAHGVDTELAEQYSTELTSWANTIRLSFQANAIEDVIATRRLSHIVNAYSIFQDIKQAVALCVARFDSETRDQFIALFDKVHVDVVPAAPLASPDGINLQGVAIMFDTLTSHGQDQAKAFFQQVGVTSSDAMVKVLNYVAGKKGVRFNDVLSVESMVNAAGGVEFAVQHSDNSRVTLTSQEIVAIL